MRRNNQSSLVCRRRQRAEKTYHRSWRRQKISKIPSRVIPWSRAWSTTTMTSPTRHVIGRPISRRRRESSARKARREAARWRSERKMERRRLRSIQSRQRSWFDPETNEWTSRRVEEIRHKRSRKQTTMRAQTERKSRAWTLEVQLDLSERSRCTSRSPARQKI